MARFRLNPFTGMFDEIGDASGSGGNPTFSYQHILSGQSITIPSHQSMLLLGDIIIDSGGELVISDDSSLVIL